MEVESYGEPNNYMKYIMLECNLSSSGHLFACGSASFIRVPLRIETIPSDVLPMRSSLIPRTLIDHVNNAAMSDRFPRIIEL
jgi:hypothetical protein